MFFPELPAVQKSMEKNCRASSKIEHQLKRVIAATSGLTAKEQDRIYADLCILAKRVEVREYQRGRFNKNILNIQDRSEELLDDLTFLSSIGRVWETLFDQVRLTAKTTVIDIGCGVFPKVELGLFYRCFAGKVTLVDTSPGAIQRALSFIDFFNPAFTADGVCGDLFKVGLQKADVVTGNHLLDDLLLSSFCETQSVPLDRVYGSEKGYAQIWAKIQKTDQHAIKTAKRVAAALDEITSQKGVIILFDYLSHSHLDLGLSCIREVVAVTQHELQRELEARNFEAVTFQAELPGFGRVVPERRDIIFVKRNL